MTNTTVHRLNADRRAQVNGAGIRGGKRGRKGYSECTLCPLSVMGTRVVFGLCRERDQWRDVLRGILKAGEMSGMTCGPHASEGERENMRGYG